MAKMIAPPLAEAVGDRMVDLRAKGETRSPAETAELIDLLAARILALESALVQEETSEE